MRVSMTIFINIITPETAVSSKRILGRRPRPLPNGLNQMPGLASPLRAPLYRAKRDRASFPLGGSPAGQQREPVARSLLVCR